MHKYSILYIKKLKPLLYTFYLLDSMIDISSLHNVNLYAFYIIFVDTPVKEIIDLVEKPKFNKCINTNCKGECSELIYAPDFCLSYFR